MSTKTTMETRKKTAQAIIPSRSFMSQRRVALPQHVEDVPESRGKSLHNTAAHPGFGHDFSRIMVHSDAKAVEPRQSCPLASASPRFCPFGGACHTCPARVQAKLAISQAGDEYEQEADRVAKQVIHMPERRLQQQVEEEEEEEILQAKPPGQGQTSESQSLPQAPPIVHEVLRSPGQSLDPTTRTFMESRFGQDFSQVRAHTDAKAAESARAVNALAYTTGRDVVFGAGQYAPGTSEGRRLLAHELTHAMQQGTQKVSSPPLVLASEDNLLEHQAQRLSESLAAGERPLSRKGSRVEIRQIGSPFQTLQRQSALPTISPAIPVVDDTKVQKYIDEAIKWANGNLSVASTRITVLRNDPDKPENCFDENLAAADAWSKYIRPSAFAVPASVLAKLPTVLQPAARETRLHNDDFAHQAAETFGLEAFTVGRDVYFGHGRWQPEKDRGLALLQHELGHVHRGEERQGIVEGWSTQGHRTITLRALEGDSCFSPSAQMLLANTAPVPDFNRPQILQDMVSFWSGESLWRAPLGLVGGAILGGITPPEQGTQIGGVRVSGVLPQAILGTGLIPTVPAEERVRGVGERPELQRTRVTQELANHGEDLPARNIARMNYYVDQGIAAANRCDLYNGLVQLGYALHIAQDRGSHGDGYTADYVQNRPHSEIDSISANPAGFAVAINNSREALNRFYDGLVELKRQMLSSSPVLGQAVPTTPPVIETLLAPPASAVIAPPVTAEERGRLSGGINILSVQF